MSTMVLEVYDALKEAGASEVSARRAAEAVLLGDSSRLDGIGVRFKRIERRFDKVDALLERIDQTLVRLEARGSTQDWMIGACVTLVVLVLGKLLLLSH